MSGEAKEYVIVGGGPAGIAAALELRKAGRQVTLLERGEALGGAARHCAHSPFGMREFGWVYNGPAFARRLQRAADDAGIDVRLNHSVVRIDAGGAMLVASPGGSARLAPRRVILATGAREKPRSARLMPGDRAPQIITTGTLQAMIALEGLRPFRRPVIVGTELISLSAVLTCLSHGIRPTAVVEPNSRPTARFPLTLFPRVAGIPMYLGTCIVDIFGEGCVESVTLERGSERWQTECDGVLLTGAFTPESALLLDGPHGVDPGSFGPSIDQFGRLSDPAIFAAGNLLRPIETGGWAFREGRAIGSTLGRNIEIPDCEAVQVSCRDPIRLVVPQRLSRCRLSPAHNQFQIRMQRTCRGRLSMWIDGRETWSRKGVWRPERRILVPIPSDALDASNVMFEIEGS